MLCEGGCRKRSFSLPKSPSLLTRRTHACDVRPQHPSSPDESSVVIRYTTAVALEANLLPMRPDEVHLMVHANGPHNAFKNNRSALFWRRQLKRFSLGKQTLPLARNSNSESSAFNTKENGSHLEKASCLLALALAS